MTREEIERLMHRGHACRDLPGHIITLIINTTLEIRNGKAKT